MASPVPNFNHIYQGYALPEVDRWLVGFLWFMRRRGIRKVGEV